MHAREEQTIIAQCTPQGNGTLALLRVSGVDAISIVDKAATLPGKKHLCDKETHTIHYGWLVDNNNNRLDQVMFLLMRAPKTFTGQDTVEITCHNNPFLIDTIITELINHGARPAEGGEFSQRAFNNDKIDLTQAEAINELIHAQSQTALQKSLSNLQGSLSNWMKELEQQITRALSWSEASFEFLDEEGDFASSIDALLTETINRINTLSTAYDAQQHIREGIRIALIGSVNAGKSSVFNGLIRHNRAIVTEIAGTTRDSIEAGVYRDGVHWTLIDTAGLRKTEDRVEQEGIKRSYDEAEKADIVVLIVDGARTLSEQEHTIYQELLDAHASKTILVYNKADIFAQEPYSKLTASQHVPVRHTATTEAEKQTELEHCIGSRVQSLLGSDDTPFLLNKRHTQILQTLRKKLEDIQNLLHANPVHYEIVSYHLKDALEHISQVTGKSVSEAGLDQVFREFCVGK